MQCLEVSGAVQPL